MIKKNINLRIKNYRILLQIIKTKENKVKMIVYKNLKNISIV
jgi:hypothetical protein